MAAITLGLLKLGLMILALALIPISLVAAIPFILVWPRPMDGRSWGQIIRGRYGRVLNGVLLIANVVDVITGP